MFTSLDVKGAAVTDAISRAAHRVTYTIDKINEQTGMESSIGSIFKVYNLRI